VLPPDHRRQDGRERLLRSCQCLGIGRQLGRVAGFEDAAKRFRIGQHPRLELAHRRANGHHYLSMRLPRALDAGLDPLANRACGIASAVRMHDEERALIPPRVDGRSDSLVTSIRLAWVVDPYRRCEIRHVPEHVGGNLRQELIEQRQKKVVITRPFGIEARGDVHHASSRIVTLSRRRSTSRGETVVAPRSLLPVGSTRRRRVERRPPALRMASTRTNDSR
jgi:hypothetical protein